MAPTDHSTSMEKGPVSEHNEPIHSDILAADAGQAAAAEHQMSLLQAIKTYPKAIGWSVLLSSTLIMGTTSVSNHRYLEDTDILIRGLRSGSTR